MSPAPRLTQAGALATLLSLVALSCGSDLVSLLPPDPTAAGGSAAGADSNGGAEAAGASSGGATTEGGGTAQQGGVGGSGPWGGYAGSSGGCSGFACAGAGQGSFGGVLGNSNCNGDGSCKAGYSCDRLVGRCGPSCQETSDCDNGRVCDTFQSVCVQCIEDNPCQNDFDPKAHICYLHRCVECVVNTDCPPGERNVCSRSFQCVQLQCVSDEDCKDNPNGENHCDVPRGRCE